MLYLLIMSLLAGILTGIVGMASLILYPVLLTAGLPPISANVTITVAQVVGKLGAMLSSLRELSHYRHQALMVAIWNTIGGLLGAELLIHSSNAAFKKIVPIFILAAGILILSPAKEHQQSARRGTRWLEWTSLFLIGVYSGYFGAASGLLIIAILTRIIPGNYAEINALRIFSEFCSNTIAAGLFIVRLKITWSILLPLIVGIFIGGLLGPIIARIVPSKIIKKIVGVFAIGLAFFLAWKDWF